MGINFNSSSTNLNIQNKNISTDGLKNKIKTDLMTGSGNFASPSEVLNNATQIISSNIEIFEDYSSILTDDYKLESYLDSDIGTILLASKEGESSKFYLLNDDNTINGTITLDSDKNIKETKFEKNTVTIEYIDGTTSTYDINRIKRSIELAQKYEGTTAGKYYNTDGEKVVEVANSQLGKEYVYGASGPDAFDCSGLVGFCLTGKTERIGTTYTFMEWPETNTPQIGDICVNENHTGIYIGDGQMIHAATEGVGVIIGPVQDGMKYVVYPGD